MLKVRDGGEDIWARKRLVKKGLLRGKNRGRGLFFLGGRGGWGAEDDYEERGKLKRERVLRL